MSLSILDPRDAAIELGRVAALLLARLGEFAGHRVVQVKLELVLLLRRAGEDVGLGHRAWREQRGRTKCLESIARREESLLDSRNTRGGPWLRILGLAPGSPAPSATSSIAAHIATLTDTVLTATDLTDPQS